jgi:uncharacterized membrane protein (UPF0127 family)
MVALVLVTVCLPFVGCKTVSKHPVVSVSFVTPSGTSPSFSMEVVANDADRSRGLMFRRELQSNEGMLFVFPDEIKRSFWMKNTLIPLDMVFVSSDRKVVGILSHVPPLTEESRSVGKPSMYVLEFAGGTMRKFGIEAGASVLIDGKLPIAH